jgi:hypothetical protein
VVVSMANAEATSRRLLTARPKMRGRSIVRSEFECDVENLNLTEIDNNENG